MEWLGNLKSLVDPGDWGRMNKYLASLEVERAGYLGCVDDVMGIGDMTWPCSIERVFVLAMVDNFCESQCWFVPK